MQFSKNNYQYELELLNDSIKSGFDRSNQIKEFSNYHGVSLEVVESDLMELNTVKPHPVPRDDYQDYIIYLTDYSRPLVVYGQFEDVLESLEYNLFDDNKQKESLLNAIDFAHGIYAIHGDNLRDMKRPLKRYVGVVYG